MRTLNLNHNINEIKSIKSKYIRCTLLIPKLYLKKLDKLKYIESNSLEDLLNKFSLLIEKKIIIISPNLEKHTTQYQGQSKEILNLSRCHLRCNPMVWHHWKRLANHYGVSMCNLFFICLKNITLKDLDSVGTPTESLCLHNNFFFEVTNIARFYSHRWFYSRRSRKKLK